MASNEFKIKIDASSWNKTIVEQLREMLNHAFFQESQYILKGAGSQIPKGLLSTEDARALSEAPRRRRTQKRKPRAAAPKPFRAME